MNRIERIDLPTILDNLPSLLRLLATCLDQWGDSGTLATLRNPPPLVQWRIYRAHVADGLPRNEARAKAREVILALREAEDEELQALVRDARDQVQADLQVARARS